MERNLHKMYGLESYVAVVVQHSEKTSGELIRGEMKFSGISAIIKSIMAARLSERRMVLIQRAIVTSVWSVIGNWKLWLRRFSRASGQSKNVRMQS